MIRSALCRLPFMVLWKVCCLFPDDDAAAGLMGGQDQHLGNLYVLRGIGGKDGNIGNIISRQGLDAFIDRGGMPPA